APRTWCGMSWSLRSRKTGTWVRTRSTAGGPALTNRVRPTLTNATSPARRSASPSARSGPGTSAATMSGFRDTTRRSDASSGVAGPLQPLAGEELADPLSHVDQHGRIEEVGRAHLDGPRSCQEEL